MHVRIHSFGFGNRMVAITGACICPLVCLYTIRYDKTLLSVYYKHNILVLYNKVCNIKLTKDILLDIDLVQQVLETSIESWYLMQ